MYLLLYNHSSSSQHGLRVLGGWDYVNFRVGDVTNPAGMSCSPYQPFVVVLFFKRKYLPLLWTLSVVTLIMLFMLKQQHYTLTQVIKVNHILHFSSKTH